MNTQTAIKMSGSDVEHTNTATTSHTQPDYYISDPIAPFFYLFFTIRNTF